VPQIVYVGPFDEVTIPALGIASAKPGESVEVTADGAKSLLDQADTWAPAGSAAAKAAAKRVKDTAARVAAQEAELEAAAATAAGHDPAPDETPAPAGREG
jgi:hypothetical protein